MVSRRDFIKFGAATAAAAVTPGINQAHAKEAVEWRQGGINYSPLSGIKRKAVPTICAQCASHCPAIGYVEDGHVVKIEGHPDSIRTQGRLCSRGQAAVNQIYDPDRILHPLRRTGARGEGKWERISWDDALNELAGRLKKLRDDGTPEKFMFHHGWISASARHLINDVFLATYGTATIAGQTCLGQGAKYSAHELTWGGSYDNWDIDKTNFILNFGSNFMEAHTNHVALARRLASAFVDRNLEMVTFDVRLSNTAAKSRQWVPVMPGSDLAVVLAMCNVVMSEDLYRGAGEEFLAFCKVTAKPDATVEEKVAALKDHLAKYTPEWAEKISTVEADRIRSIAREFARKKPACIVSSRGAVAHHNGVETERAIQMLAAITGNIGNPGGRCPGVVPEWVYPTGPKDKPRPRRLEILNGFEGTVVLPTHGVGHQVLRMIEDGRAGRPDVYLWCNYNPVYSNGDVAKNIEILKNEKLIPYTVCVSPFYDESAMLADLILPDAIYLERYDIEEGVSPTQVPEYALRQPLVDPQGEARDFKDVCCDLAERIGIPLGFKSGEKFIEQACKQTPLVRRGARGFRGLKRSGVWHNTAAEPLYYAYRDKVDRKELEKDGVILDAATGVYWNWQASGAASREDAESRGYAATPDAFKGYVGQVIGDAVYAGFKPAILNKSGYFELYSAILEEKGLPPLPTFAPVPEHQNLGEDELVLTTFKVNVQTLSNTQNCKWLDEIYHDNPAWMSVETARKWGIVNGDKVRIASAIGKIEATAKVTQVIAPGIVAISAHAGRWAYGRYASGKRAPDSFADSDIDLKWWTNDGVHPNWIIPNAPEPISGQQRWMDTIVKISKVEVGA